MTRLDIALISAIRQGEQDIYLPDDTHWGSTGHQIVAKTLLTFLQMPESGNLANPPPFTKEGKEFNDVTGGLLGSRANKLLFP